MIPSFLDYPHWTFWRWWWLELFNGHIESSKSEGKEIVRGISYRQHWAQEVWINLTFLSLICFFRFDGFEQGLNNFHINAKSILGQQQNSENCRKSPPNKKTKKTNLDFSLDNPNTGKETKFGDSDKFLFLGKYKAIKITPCSRKLKKQFAYFLPWPLDRHWPSTVKKFYCLKIDSVHTNLDFKGKLGGKIEFLN